MRKSLLWVAGLLLAPTCFGQDLPSAQEKKSAGFVFVAPGTGLGDGGPALIHFGGGGESLIKGGFGVSAELGYLFAPQVGFGQGLGILAPGAFYRFRRNAKTAPFVAGGWGLAFPLESQQLVHVGGGVDHWFNSRFGLRVEGKSFFVARSPGHPLVQARIALLIR